MSTIMPEGKRIRDAVKWIDEEQKGGRDLKVLVNEAGPRFDLSPKELEFLKGFYLDQENKG